MLLAAVLSGYVLAALAPWLQRRAPRAAGPLLALLPLALTAYFAQQAILVAEEGARSTSWDWIPSLDVALAFRLDGLSAVFVLLISGIGAGVVLYASSYLAGDPLLGRFYFYLLFFMASMLGVALADNILLLFVFWELTSISSYLLIGFRHEALASRRAALQALLVTGGGGLILMAGLVLLGQVAGTANIGVLAAQGDAIRAHDLYLVVLVLIGIGAFTKSAQFPFHFWLPAAMEAPTPVSAYLHSATMVKAGVYLLARLSPALGGTDEWTALLATVGGTTMLLTAFVAWRQVDLKRILAYSTVSVLGLLVMLLGIGTDYAVKAAMTYLVAHALYKGALFLVAGAVDHETGTRDVRALGGLARVMPFTAAAAGLAAASMAGLPPMYGFISKEVFYHATTHAPDAPELLTALAVLSSIMVFAAAGLVALKPFFGARPQTPKTPHEAPWPMLAAALVLAVLGLLVAVVPAPVVDYMLRPASEAVLGAETEVELHLWSGFNLVLWLSVLTLVVGALLYVARAPLARALGGLDMGPHFGPARLYDALLDGMLGLAKWQTRTLQNGYLRFYLIAIVFTSVILIGIPLLAEMDLSEILRMPDARIYELVIAVVILAATLTATQARSRLAAVAALGTVGYSIALLYILFGAPDLAMTQFAIETLTVLLFVLVLYRLPRFTTLSGRGVRLRDGAIALSVGALMTLLVLVVTAAPASERLTSYFAQNAVLLGKGRNIVNVILVDFRGLDTLGEIVVLSVAAAGVYSLMKLRPLSAPATRTTPAVSANSEQAQRRAAREKIPNIEAPEVPE